MVGSEIAAAVSRFMWTKRIGDSETRRIADVIRSHITEFEWEHFKIISDTVGSYRANNKMPTDLAVISAFNLLVYVNTRPI